MDFEKMSAELEKDEAVSENSDGRRPERYNTQYLVADLKSSNKAPKIIICSVVAVLAIGIAAFLLSGNNTPADNNATIAPAAAVANDAASDAASDKSK